MLSEILYLNFSSLGSKGYGLTFSRVCVLVLQWLKEKGISAGEHGNTYYAVCGKNVNGKRIHLLRISLLISAFLMTNR